MRFYRNDAYETITGLVTRMDPEYRYITIVKTKIPFDDITDVSSPEIPDGERKNLLKSQLLITGNQKNLTRIVLCL